MPQSNLTRKPGESVSAFTERTLKQDPSWQEGRNKQLGESFVRRAKKSDAKRKQEKKSRKRNRSK